MSENNEPKNNLLPFEAKSKSEFLEPPDPPLNPWGCWIAIFGGILGWIIFLYICYSIWELFH